MVRPLVTWTDKENHTQTQFAEEILGRGKPRKGTLRDYFYPRLVLTHQAYGRMQQPLHLSPQTPQIVHNHWTRDNAEKCPDTKRGWGVGRNK